MIILASILLETQFSLFDETSLKKKIVPSCCFSGIIGNGACTCKFGTDCAPKFEIIDEKNIIFTENFNENERDLDQLNWVRKITETVPKTDR
jgi:hypothetical protein